MDFWRRSAGRSRLEKATNDKITEIMKVETTIVDEIQHRQLIWYGHVERMELTRIPKQILKWTPTEKRKRGRPRATWTGSSNDDSQAYMMSCYVKLGAYSIGA